jgi:GH18 family chitinase
MAKHNFKTLLLTILLLAAPAVEANKSVATPKLYSYWAGWINHAIPAFSFDGLYLAFAQMKKGKYGNFYSDYQKSGNFHVINTEPSAYTTWHSWTSTYEHAGAKGLVSYGGDSNTEFRGYIINASYEQLSSMAGEIKANIKGSTTTAAFAGVDIDIESWWDYSSENNKKFAVNLATLVKILRKSLDDDDATRGKLIMLTVGWGAAGAVPKPLPSSNEYDGSMLAFFNDAEAMSATAAINIMLYNTSVTHLYTNYSLIDSMLTVFTAVVPAEKLFLGIQPKESPGQTIASLDTVTALAEHIAAKGIYGGMFLWGIGCNNLTAKQATDYLTAMKKGLGIQ